MKIKSFMRNLFLTCVFTFPFFFSFSLLGTEGKQTLSFDQFMTSFDYKERKAMKIGVGEALDLYKEGKAIFVDIRFPEETKFVTFSLAKTIPLNELPGRLKELDKSKLIITFCPHYDRAAIARLYLVNKGYKSRYLVEGLMGILDELRGDQAKDFYEELKKNGSMK